MGLVGSGTKAIAQHLISSVAAGLPEMGPDVSPEGTTVWRPLLPGARQQAGVVGASFGCLECQPQKGLIPSMTFSAQPGRMLKLSVFPLQVVLCCRMGR